MANWIPIACSLDGDKARRRSEEWRALASQRLDVDRSEHHLSIRFLASDALRTELDKLVAAERECCGFVKWDFEDMGDQLMVTVRGDPDGVLAMAKTFRLES